MRELDSTEISELLGRNGVGVMAFRDETHPYPIPTGFGYEHGDDQFVVQLLSREDSRKQDCIERDGHVGFTVYEERESGVWQSVILQGCLERGSYDESEQAFEALNRDTKGAPNPVLWNSMSGEVVPYELQVEEANGQEFSHY
jgi:nitroimidazol reductase NimA-like FMN-containing flavoprotein (pyridoxamine 5'-phosphate oxidase superfamily)